MTITELAREAADYFETATRDNGEIFVRRRDDTPEWVQDLIQEAHGQFFPDDWRYQAISRVLDEIADRDVETADEIRNDDAEIADGLTDIYTGSLIQWLGSNLSRTGYVDDATEELGYPGSIVQAMQYGQLAEYREIIESVAQSLESRLDELETV
jgi:hypothetical protein